MDVSVNTPVEGRRIYVGLSGGVDSGVTAALLQRAGAEVTGVFIKGWYPPGMPCTWADDRRDAMRVAAHLRIPFITLDASREYKEGVIDYLLREYRAGRTPNPDVKCNREVKFGAFARYAKQKGAERIATGHYARVLQETGRNARLMRGIDADKDQSYFLWAMAREALEASLFPLGGMHKLEVRKLAAEFGLPNAHKRDSQGICFLGNVSVEDFLGKEFGTEPGKAVNEAGEELGMHTGALLHTLGQRIALTDAPAGPWYVVAKDIAANTLTVAHEPQSALRTRFVLTDMNWLSNPVEGKTLSAQYRYHGPRVAGTYDAANASFILDSPLKDPVAAGQSLVLYSDDECLGGGIIA